jgi:hypothetical protein
MTSYIEKTKTPSETKEYQRNKRRAWRWRHKHLTQEEIAEHNFLIRATAARRRWDTRGRLPPGESERRHVQRSMAWQRAHREHVRSYMRDYYQRKPWKWDTCRRNRWRYRGKTVSLDLRMSVGMAPLADFTGRATGHVA